MGEEKRRFSRQRKNNIYPETIFLFACELRLAMTHTHTPVKKKTSFFNFTFVTFVRASASFLCVFLTRPPTVSLLN